MRDSSTLLMQSGPAEVGRRTAPRACPIPYLRFSANLLRKLRPEAGFVATSHIFSNHLAANRVPENSPSTWSGRFPYGASMRRAFVLLAALLAFAGGCVVDLSPDEGG